MPRLEVVSPYEPTGDQPQAISGLVEGLNRGLKHQVLLGATGTGKTHAVARVIEQTQRPTLVIAHNKTLAAQLYAEFKEFFPRNAVEYFVSYYDYYQPEAYVPRLDLYIEKESDINEEIERLRLAAAAALMTRRDVVIVASVSCIYGLVSPQTWEKAILRLKVGQTIRRDAVLRHLVTILYDRNDLDLKRGTFRVRGDTLELIPGYAEYGHRLYLFGDEIERIVTFDPTTGEILEEPQELVIMPAKQYVAESDVLPLAIRDIEAELEDQLALFRREGKLLEAQRLEQRARYDIEMLREVGHCSGIENYSRHMDRRAPGTPPYTLLDYFPKDFLLVIDESHMSIPQIRGMYNGDQRRKQVLVEYGFRLPCALDNRPLNFEEFKSRTNQIIYTSATPGPYEYEVKENVVQQVIRPTGIVDPEISLRPVMGQVDDLLKEINVRIKRGERALVTTLTKRMAEDLSTYLTEVGIRVHYLHSEIDTLQRVEILRDLRLGVYDVVVGINLLREGLDLPEVSLVAILDADKEGFLRSEQALIQTIGRAARHLNGQVIMYADKITDSMRRAIDETTRRRAIQVEYNEKHNIKPASIVKQIRDLTDRVKAQVAEEKHEHHEVAPEELSVAELNQMVREIEKSMKAAAKNLEFEKAAALRDQIVELRKIMVLKEEAVKIGGTKNGAPLLDELEQEEIG
ncbi:MAG: excinuclease ABC subunit UvrB [Anaerolineae bacterium]|nr:excinuclease ABC subunit UvrB [Anaerolineae bacterium]